MSKVPSATKLVKHQEKASQSKVEKQEQERVQANAKNAALVQRLAKAFEDKDSKTAMDILKQPSLLKSIMYPTKLHDIVCLYALHVIMLTIKDANYQDILQQMSDADIKNLRKILATAQARPRPDGDMTVKYLYSLENEINQGNGNIVAEAKEVSVGLYLSVYDKWDEAIAELTKLSGALDGFVRTTPAKQKWVSMKELAELLGFKEIGAFYNLKRKLSRKHPNIDDWFENYGNQGKLFNMEHFEELKKWADEKQKKGEQAQTQEETWTILELVDKIGLTGETEDKKRNRLFGLKCRLKKKFPAVADYFTPDGQYFKVKYFEDFKALVEKYRRDPKSSKVVATVKTEKFLEGESFWSMETLAGKLKVSKHTLATIKWQLKNDNPDLIGIIDSWFVSSNDAKGKAVKLFKAEHFDALKDLIDKGKKRKPKEPVKVGKVTEQVKKHETEPVDAAEIKAALDKVLVKKDSEPAVIPNPKLVEPKMTLVDVMALEKMLARWIKMLESVSKEKDLAEQEYADVLSKLTQAEPSERAGLLNQMQLANENVIAAAARVKELQSRIDTAKSFAKDREEAVNVANAAAETKRKADQALADIDAEIVKFMQNISANQK